MADTLNDTLIMPELAFHNSSTHEKITIRVGDFGRAIRESHFIAESRKNARGKCDFQQSGGFRAAICRLSACGFVLLFPMIR